MSDLEMMQMLVVAVTSLGAYNVGRYVIGRIYKKKEEQKMLSDLVSSLNKAVDKAKKQKGE